MRLSDAAHALMLRAVPHSKDRRALSVGIAAIGLLLLTGRGIPAWRRWEEGARLGAEESAHQLDAARVAVLTRVATHRTTQSLGRQLDSLSHVSLRASSRAIAGAALATLMTELGDESGLRVTSTSVRPDSATRSALTRVAVRISATGDAEGLADYLQSIESSEQLLAVRELAVTQSDPAAPDSRAEALRVELLVEALVRIDPPLGTRRDTVPRGANAPAPLKS